MLTTGTKAPYFSLKDIYGVHRTLSDYKGKKLMISFYRYAACTFCNLRIAELIKLYPKLSQHDFELIAFFQSPAEKILEYAGAKKPPFPIFPDPKREIYKQYGVLQSSTWKYLLGIMNLPKLLRSFKDGVHWGDTDGDTHLLPADFLIDEQGNIATAYYAKDISDHLKVEEIKKFIHIKNL
jgi:peroxiredoxin